jgi:hypothetical protein
MIAPEGGRWALPIAASGSRAIVDPPAAVAPEGGSMCILISLLLDLPPSGAIVAAAPIKIVFFQISIYAIFVTL